MSAGLSSDEIRNEAIQMFRDLPDNLRANLLTRILTDPQFPALLMDSDDSDTAMGFHFFIERPRSHQLWSELNSIVATMVRNHIPLQNALSLYPIVHRHLLAMGQTPAQGAANQAPPVLAWIANFSTQPIYHQLMMAAGQSAPTTAPPVHEDSTPLQGGRRKRKSRKSKRKARKTRKYKSKQK